MTPKSGCHAQREREAGARRHRSATAGPGGRKDGGRLTALAIFASDDNGILYQALQSISPHWTAPQGVI